VIDAFERTAMFRQETHIGIQSDIGWNQTVFGIRDPHFAFRDSRAKQSLH